MGVYYRPPDQEEEVDEESRNKRKLQVDEAFYRQLQAASQSQALVLMGDFNHPDINWEDHTTRQVQSRRFLQSIDDNFLNQVVEEPTRKGALLDRVLTNKEGMVEDVKVGCRLCCSDHEMGEFMILRGGSRAISRIKTLDFRRAKFGLFNELLGGIPWATVLEGRGVQECWSLFKHYFLHAQERCILLRKKSSKRRQETCMVKQGASSRDQVGEKGPWNVERGTSHLGRVQECCQSGQSDEEGQGPPGIEAGKGCQKQQEGLLQLHQQQKEG